MLRSILRGTLAASLLLSPIAVSAQAAPPVAAVAAPEAVEGSSQLAGDPSPLFAIGILVLVIIGAYVLSSDDEPSSP